MSLARNCPILGMPYRLLWIRDSSCFADLGQRPKLALRPLTPLLYATHSVLHIYCLPLFPFSVNAGLKILQKIFIFYIPSC